MEEKNFNPKFFFVITVILILFVRGNHEILMVNYAKLNQKLGS
jgi:hypothetical protein